MEQTFQLYYTNMSYVFQFIISSYIIRYIVVNIHLNTIYIHHYFFEDCWVFSLRCVCPHALCEAPVSCHRANSLPPRKTTAVTSSSQGSVNSRSGYTMNIAGEKSRLAQLTVSKAVGRMIVDHSNRLHERITDRRTGEFEPPVFQVLTHGIGDGRVAGNVSGRLPAIGDRSAVNEGPNVLVKAADLLLDQKKSLRIGNGRLNFKPVPNDTGLPSSRRIFVRRIWRLPPGQSDQRPSGRRHAFEESRFQLNPACAPSRMRNSNNRRSSCTGTPHSSSWYWVRSALVAQEHRVGAGRLIINPCPCCRSRR